MSEENKRQRRVKIGPLIAVGAVGGAVFGAVVAGISVASSPGGFMPPWFSIALVTVLSGIGGVIAASVSYLGILLLLQTGVEWTTYIGAFLGAGLATFSFAQLLTHGNGFALNLLAGVAAALGLSFTAWVYTFRHAKVDAIAGVLPK